MSAKLKLCFYDVTTFYYYDDERQNYIHCCVRIAGHFSLRNIITIRVPTIDFD